MHAPNDTTPSPQSSQGEGLVTLSLSDEVATHALGAALASVLQPGLIVTLEGDLGAGKTTLVRGLLRALGYANKVKSPTYTLVEVHVVSGLNLYHFDFYRFNQPEEYLEAGLDEYFQTSGPNAGVCLVEWPDKAGTYPATPRPLRTAFRRGRITPC